jgi:hypothetical protein
MDVLFEAAARPSFARDATRHGRWDRPVGALSAPLPAPAKSTTRVTRRLDAPASRIWPFPTWQLLASP